MLTGTTEQIERLKRTLTELRANREAFSSDTFALIMMVLLERLRVLQTDPAETALPSDEVRLVSVIFIDVKDSTELARQLDTSDWKTVIAGAHQRIAQVIAQWDGQIGQYLGDGVLCFFGAQRSRSNDTQRAVSCSLAIQEAIKAYAPEVEARYGIDFGVRIGMSTGRVVVGMIGSATKQELLALGLTTNLAARLQGEAPVGGVLIDSATYTRIRADFVTQAFPPLNLKGFIEPVKAYSILGKRTQPATQLTESHVNNFHLPLVGRDEDLALINHLCERALHEAHFQVITLMGDIGMGKSRLLQEVVRLQEAHFTTIIMTAQYEARGTAYNLLRDMLMTHCDLRNDLDDEMINQQIIAFVTDNWASARAKSAAQAIGYLAGFNFPQPDVDAFALTVDWFCGMAHENSLLIAVDNLQWVDRDSIALLEAIAETMADTRSVMIAAGTPEYRSIYPDYMQSHSQHARIMLDRLHPDASLQLIETLIEPIARTPHDLAQRINARVEGNPLFVREFVAMFFDMNVFVKRDDDTWRFNIIPYESALNTLPNGLVSVLQARMDDLTPDMRYIMQVASVAGQRFWTAAVAEMAQINAAQPLLDALMQRGVIIQQQTSSLDGEREYAFRHAIYRDVAYEMLPRNQRQDLHHVMASWLLQHIAEQRDHYAALATHFDAAGLHGAALYTYLEAVQDLIQCDYLQDALPLIDRGLAIARNIPRDEAVSVVSKLWAWRGEVLVKLGRYEEASAASKSSLMLLSELPLDQFVGTRIQVERTLGLAYMRQGRFNDAYDALTQAYNDLGKDAIVEIAAVLRSLGELNLCRGRLEDAHAYLRRSLLNAEKAQDPREIADTLSLLGQISLDRGDPQTALVHFRDVNTFNKDRSLTSVQVEALRHIGLVYMILLQFDQAAALFDEGTQRLDDGDEPDVLLQAYRALTMILSGQQPAGLALLQDAFSHGSHDIHTHQRLHLTYITGLGNVQDYARCYEQALHLCEQTRNSNPLIHARSLRWLGIASMELTLPDAFNRLQDALQAELDYGGRDVWLCHATLARYAPKPDTTQKHYQHAAKLLKARANLLTSDSLRSAFLAAPYVQRILSQAG